MKRIGTAIKTRRDKALLKALPDLLDGKDDDEMFAGKTTVGAVRSMIEGHLQAMARVFALTVARRAAVAEERKSEQELRPVIHSLKSLASARVGKHSAEMRRLGFEPDKKPKMTAMTKLVANVKRQATRKARGIVGKKRRKAR